MGDAPPEIRDAGNGEDWESDLTELRLYTPVDSVNDELKLDADSNEASSLMLGTSAPETNGSLNAELRRKSFHLSLSSNPSAYQPRFISSVKRSSSAVEGFSDTFAIDFNKLTFARQIRADRWSSLWKAYWLRLPVLVTFYYDGDSNSKEIKLTAAEYASSRGISMTDLYADLGLHSTFRHPSLLLHMCSVVENEKPFCLVNEYRRCKPLSGFADDFSVFSLLQVLKLSISIARGLLYLHVFDPPQLHGFLHPSNILIDEKSSDCVLSEFRLQHQRRPLEQNITDAVVVRFLAPELLEGGELTQETDIYAFGMVLWQLWKGEVPFEQFDATKIKAEILAGNRPDPGDMPEVLRNIYNDCVHSNPQKRPSSEAILQILRSDETEEKISSWDADSRRNNSNKLHKASAPVSINLARPPTRQSDYQREGSIHSQSPKTTDANDKSLLKAVSDNDVQHVIELLDLGASIEARTYDKRTPLHLAACNGNVDMVNALLSRGALVDVRDRWGSTPIHDAQQARHHEVHLLLQLQSQKASSSFRGLRRSSLSRPSAASSLSNDYFSTKFSQD